jgi:hypothetical protein
MISQKRIPIIHYKFQTDQIYKVIIVFFMTIFVNKFPELQQYRVVMTAETLGDKNPAAATSPFSYRK